jgi:rhomboid protease GluP
MGGEDDRREKDSDWIERAVRLAGAVGMNPVRVRWKLQRWKNRREEARNRRAQKLLHIRYQHKKCAGCGALQDREARQCTSCGERLGSWRWQVVQRVGLPSMSALIGVAIALVYGRLLLASGGGGLLSLDVELLYRFGGHWAPAVAAGETWRWFTAIFLHAGLWHIGFNLFALAIIGPHVENLYGRGPMLLLFMVTGVLASIGSMLAGLSGLGVGASGAIMGLVGIAAGWGQRQGTSQGAALRNEMLRWSAYVFVFGFLIGADNWAHLFGLASGAAIGFAVRPEWLRLPAARPAVVVASVIGAAAALGTFALVMSQPGG